MALLQRFKLKKKPPTRLEEIVRHLNSLLNTKRHYGSFYEKLGISDCSSFSNQKELLETLEIEIRENLHLYEPRIELININPLPHSLLNHLRFELECKISDDPQSLFVTVNTKLNQMKVNA